MATTYYTEIQKLYVAYFNRPADVAGLAYWEAVVEANAGKTTAVSAAFAASAEYKAAYAGQTNEQIVNTVYLNLFSHASDAPGQAYWADLLTRNKITIDGVVTAIAAGALTTDLTAYNNKVLASSAFTAALDTPAEVVGYANPAANPVAKAFLSGITSDLSLQAALAPATLNASVAAVVAAGTPFTLSGALATLQTATDAKAAFLDVAIDGKVGGTISTDASIAANVAAKVTLLDDVVTGDYTNSSAAVKAALLADQVAANASLLATHQATVSTDNANIAKVAGLSTAINTAAATKAGVTAATSANLTALADLNAKLATYNTLNGTSLAMDASGNGTITGLIKLDTTNGKLIANSSTITEAANPGISALLASTANKEAADANLVAATNADAGAVAKLNYVDQSAAETTDLANIKAGLKNVTVAAGVQPTLADIATETSVLNAKLAAAVGASDISAAQANVDSFKGLVDTYKADSALAATISNPLSAKLTADAALVTADNLAITTLTKAFAAVNTANGIATQLAAVNGSVDAATKVFVDNSLSIPVNAAGSMIASAGSDIYIAGSTDASIALFGLQGADSLFIGSKYTLNTDFTKGNDAVLEVFFVQNGSNVDVKLETKAFGSSSAEAEVVITLTGTTVDHVFLANGIITVA